MGVGMQDIKTLIPIQVDSQMQIFSQMQSWTKNLNEILKNLKSRNVNVILVSLLEPFSDFYNFYDTPRDAFVMVLDMWMTKLFSIADEWNLPVIDLTRTMYCYDRSHYSALSIFENSTKSSGFIIDLIDFILHHHPFNKAESSIIYFSSRSFGGIKTEKNNIKARSAYCQNLKKQTAFKQVSKDNAVEEKQNYDDDKEEMKDDTKQNKKVNEATHEIPNDDKAKKLKARHIILMGDSVIDNFYWLKDKTKDIKQQILDTYENKVKVTNLAVDESRSQDVLYGMDPSFVYVDARKKVGLEPYPMDKNGKVIPLEIVKNMIDKKEIILNVKKHQIKPTVVLSIGGNDVRVLLYNFSMQNMMSGLEKLRQNMQKIVEKLLFDFKLNVVPVLCYEPYQDFATQHGLKREQLLQIFNIGATKIFELCETYSLPVIDLSRTFNTFDRSHYGSTSIEPSNKSGQFIVDIIQFINDNYPFNSDVKSSKIYYGLKSDKDGIVQQDNNKSARDEYLQQLLAKKK